MDGGEEMSGFGTLAFGLLVFSHSDNKRMCGGKLNHISSGASMPSRFKDMLSTCLTHATKHNLASLSGGGA